MDSENTSLVKNPTTEPFFQVPLLDPDILQRPPSHISIRQTISNSSEGVTYKPGLQSHSETQESDLASLSRIHNEYDANDGDADEEEMRNFACIECVKPIPVLSPVDIQKGNHLIFAGAVYDHHAIVIGAEPVEGNRVKVRLIEATNTVVGAAVGILKIFGGKANVTESEKIVNIQKQKLMIVLYRYPKYTTEEIIERAKNSLSNLGSEEKYKYNLIRNNCEHFATWCVTGKKFSIQARKFTVIGAAFLKRGFKRISDESVRNQLLFSEDLLCHPCFKINEKLLSAPKRNVKCKSDVKVGDIINYSYWNLWHDAIVAYIYEKECQTEIKCTIIHYAFCGIISHREIKKETYYCPLDGSVRVMDYPESHYNVYSRDEVVQRAHSRVGEQLFAFFANDSSHFARWCKLKPQKKERDVSSALDLL